MLSIHRTIQISSEEKILNIKCKEDNFKIFTKRKMGK